VVIEWRLHAVHNPPADADRLEAAPDEAIAAFGGIARDAVKALIVANEFLESGRLRTDAGCVARLRAGKIQDYPG
jgi:hypothetical protein